MENNHSKAELNQEWGINNSRCNIKKKMIFITHTRNVNSSPLRNERSKKIRQILDLEKLIKNMEIAPTSQQNLLKEDIKARFTKNCVLHN